jgi:SAM-dependent methyltransferase
MTNVASGCEDYYDSVFDSAQASARQIIPILLKWIKPASVIDVGCGFGAWLAVFEELGVRDLWGVDGEWLKPLAHKFAIPVEHFIVHDLSRPLVLDRTFDLAVSLEVAEHLPAGSAEVLVDSLVKLAPAVLFSAAIPGQDGVNHVNCQWPEYWARLFEKRGYRIIDCLRNRIWNNRQVAWWYRQNIFLFVRQDYLEKDQLLKKEAECTRRASLSRVHPDYLFLKLKDETLKLGKKIRQKFNWNKHLK